MLLRASAMGISGAGPVTISWVVLTAGGVLVRGKPRLLASAGSTAGHDVTPLPEGELVSVCVANYSGAGDMAAARVRVALYRNSVAAGNIEAVLVEGWVDCGQGVTWESGSGTVGGGIVSPVLVVTHSDPAAGAAFQYDFTATAPVDLLAVRARVVTSAAVATRNPRLEIYNSSPVSWTQFGSGTQTASLDRYYQWARYGFAPSTLTYYDFGNIGVPGGKLGGLMKVVSGTWDAADQFSEIITWGRWEAHMAWA